MIVTTARRYVSQPARLVDSYYGEVTSGPLVIYYYKVFVFFGESKIAFRVEFINTDLMLTFTNLLTFTRHLTNVKFRIETSQFNIR